MASYPGALWNLNVQDTTNDGTVDNTVAQANDYNLAANEIGAIETELGYGGSPNTPKGTAASLTARLAVSLNNDGTLVLQPLQATVTRSLTQAMAFAMISDVGSAGAPSTRPQTLPAPSPATQFTLIVSGGAAGIRVVASNGAKIRLGGNLSLTNGYIESTDPGANVVLYAVSATLWVAIGPSGIWNLDGA